VKSWPGVWSLKPGIDILCIRECTEGFLADRNLYSGNGEFMPDADTVISLRVLTRAACERIAEFAFETARKEGRRKITVVHKANVLKLGCGFFLGVVRETAARYPEIEVADEYVDNVANTLISAPESYDILLATNLFGDIISDEAAALVSNLVPSANSGPDCAVFAPVNHEGREEEAGKGIANPLAHILCASMLLRHLGENGAAEAVESAVSAVLSGGMLPLELGGNCGTAEMSGAICAALAAGQGR
jgi:isocitrate/isopropylmalate dehydrogenase